MNDLFRRFAAKASEILGSPWAFLVALSVIAAWVLAGPVLHYSEDWQLFINTGTTIVTFLMVFLIQNTQNRDVKALQLKLDELIRAGKGARNHLMNLEQFTDEEIQELEEEFNRLNEERQKRKKAKADTGTRRRGEG